MLHSSLRPYPRRSSNHPVGTRAMFHAARRGLSTRHRCSANPTVLTVTNTCPSHDANGHQPEPQRHIHSKPHHRRQPQPLAPANPPICETDSDGRMPGRTHPSRLRQLEHSTAAAPAPVRPSLTRLERPNPSGCTTHTIQPNRARPLPLVPGRVRACTCAQSFSAAASSSRCASAAAANQPSAAQHASHPRTARRNAVRTVRLQHRLELGLHTPQPRPAPPASQTTHATCKAAVAVPTNGRQTPQRCCEQPAPTAPDTPSAAAPWLQTPPAQPHG